MAFDPDYLEFMPLNVVVQKAGAGYDDYGQPLPGVVKVYKGRAQVKAVSVTTVMGEEVTSSAQLILACTDPISTDDSIPMNDATNPGGKPIINVEPVYDEDGVHHTVIYF